MKISDVAKQKAKEIRDLIKAQQPDVLYALADFMTFSDEEMDQDCVEDAVEAVDFNFHTYTRHNNQKLCAGMSLPAIAVDIWSREGEEFGDFEGWDFSADQKAAGKSIFGADKTLNEVIE